MPYEIILARMVTALDLEFEKAVHHHNEGYETDNFGLPTQVMRPVHIYSVFKTEASFDLAEFTITQHPISPFTPRYPRSLPFCEGVCQCLTFNETHPLMPEEGSEDEEDLPTGDLDDLVWFKETCTGQLGIPVHTGNTQASNPTQPAQSRSVSHPTKTT